MLKLLFPLSLVLFTSPLFGQVGTTTSALPNPIVGKAVSGTVWTLSASGGTTPYSWVVSQGSLPTGLSLSPAGTITGTATSAGAATFTLRVTDSAFATAIKQFTITAQNAIGRGCTTATIIDWDCDYYGVGSAIGMDADDNDAAVNTVASWRAKYGSGGPNDTTTATLRAYLTAVKGYNPNHFWFLATNGNDSTCAIDDITKPCLTWASVYSHSSAGDAIVLRGGTWSIAANYTTGRPGTTSAHPDYFLGYPGEKPVLDHSVAGWYGINAAFYSQSYVVIDGLTITNTPCAGGTCGVGINLNASSVTLAGIVIRNNEISNYYWGITIIAGQTGTLIEKNVIHDANEHPIYLGVNDGDTGLMSGVTVRNNILYNAGRDDFHNNGRCGGCLLDGNIMYSANMSAGGGSPNISLQQGWNHGTISNNIVFISSGYAMLFDDYDDPTPGTNIHPFDQNYNLIVNNTFIHTGRDASGQDLSNSGFTVFGVINDSAQTSPLLDLGHNTYQNNVFVEMATGGGSGNGVVRYSKHQTGDLDWLSTDTWTNNILYASNGAAPLYWGVGLGTAQNWAYFQAHAASFANNYNSVPLLTAADNSWYAAPGNYNLRVSAGSPAIGAGLSTGAPTVDIMGNVRANPPSIGAYEPANVGSTAPPASPCDLNGDGLVNMADVTLAVNQAIGISPCSTGDLTGNGTCDVMDVQRVINAALSGVCVFH